MSVLVPHEIKQTAAQRLKSTRSNPRQLVLLHTGILVGMNLLLTAVNLLLNQQIGSTGGLSGLGTRSMLQTIQTILSYCSSLLSPFLAAGLLYAMIRIARGEDAPASSLLQGFRRFGSILGASLWQMMLYAMVAVVLVYACSYLFVITPFASDFMELLEPLVNSETLFASDGTVNLDLLPMDQMVHALLPMLIVYGVVLVAVCLWLRYQFRMTNFLLVEGVRRSAFGCLMVSAKMMKGHKWQMLKLDLSFWWYYLLEGLVAVSLWLDVILALAGVSLPMGENAALILSTAVYALLELGLHLWKKPLVDEAYACAYESIYRPFLQEQVQTP